MSFIPHSESEVKSMLEAIDISSINDLFREIPSDLLIDQLEKIPDAMTEQQVGQLMQQHAQKNHLGNCFIGAGAYEHFIPAAVWDITQRGEYLTAYTPYQAEASQGTLQLIFEYQTMMASLTGMDVSNASMYDGATALVESILMAVRLRRNKATKRVLIPGNLHPAYRNVLDTFARMQHIEYVTLPFCAQSGHIIPKSLNAYDKQSFDALVIQQPNFFGGLEEVDALTDWAHQHQAMVIAVVNPTSLGLLKEPGVWGEHGVDIVCGEGQPLGVPLQSGGPYLGFLCCKKEYVRQMPGRIVGRASDEQGNRGFVLTLQAREQHIRRSKATSNICTNQGLLVTAATIYMSLLGPAGLQQVASSCHQNAVALQQQLTDIKGCELLFNRPYFHEFVIKLPTDVNIVLEKLAKHNIQGGYALTHDFPELGNALLVCATETKTKQDLDKYQLALKSILNARGQV